MIAECGTLYEGIKLSDNVWKKKYNTIFLLRRLLYAAILILFFSYPIAEYSTLLVVTIIPVIVIYHDLIGDRICHYGSTI